VSEPAGLTRELRTPRSAAVAGIIFAVILATVIALIHSAIPSSGDTTSWISDPGRRHAVSIALGLIPFAGIAFLWFIGVIRTRLGALEDKLFATVFLGSGLLFVALLFSAAAVLGSVLRLYESPPSASPETVRWAQMLVVELLGTFGARMAAVFILSVTTVGHRVGVNPRWLTVFGYLSALVLLVSPPLPRWGQLLFPAWVLALSITIWVASAPEPAER
jgi:hypothetical protein